MIGGKVQKRVGNKFPISFYRKAQNPEIEGFACTFDSLVNSLEHSVFRKPE